ncbi:MAG: toprim domain-containing protein [Prolixibacteraceae bacterium]|nr:toprim domain-containing protein [Prolixibacteraceae bacterium]
MNQIEQLKQEIPISKYLANHGIYPVRKSGNELFYHSPLRNDKNASLTVNDVRRVWFDHGSGEGGSIIDLVMQMQKTDTRGAIKCLSCFNPSTDPSTNVYFSDNEIKEKALKHQIKGTKPLDNNLAITMYLQERGIYDAARKSGRVIEVYYDYINEAGATKRFFGAGWENESGGFDVRSKYGKVCINSKDISIVGNGNIVNVFEGMIDFLSAVTDGTVSFNDKNIILNTTSLADRAILHIQKSGSSEQINLFCDNDKAGDDCTKKFKEAFSLSEDKRNLYAEFSDYNEKLMNDLSQRKNLCR